MHVSYTDSYPLSPLFFFLIIRPPPTSTLFPYTTLFRSHRPTPRYVREVPCTNRHGPGFPIEPFRTGDRKSTRLNSSHRCISYAVFCLKKKKIRRYNLRQLKQQTRQ